MIKFFLPYLNIGINTFFQILSRAVSALVALIVTRLLATHLGLTGYGEYQIVVVYASFFWVFTDFGLNILTVREMSTEPEKVQDYFSSLLSVRTFLGFVFTFVAFGALAFLPYSVSLKLALMIGSFTILLQSLTGAAGAIFQLKSRYLYFFLSNMIGSLLLLAGIFISLSLTKSVIGLSLAVVFSYFVTTLLSLYFAKRFVQLKIIFKFSILQSLIVKSIPFGLALIFNITAYSQDALLLSFIKVAGTSNEKMVGIYSLGYKLFELGIVVPGYLINVLYPMFNRLVAQKEFRKLEQSISSSIIFLFVLGVMGLAVIQIVAPFLIDLLTRSKEFGDSVTILKILALALPASFLLPLLSSMVLVFHRQSWQMVIYGFAWLLNLLANILLIPHYGYFASAWITVATEWVLLILFAVVYLNLWQKKKEEWKNEID